MRRFSGFTLIELLIVGGIIAVLAAIALPNLLEAQVRAKTSRARAELRTIATGLEAYMADAGCYPLNDGLYNVIPNSLTTPVAYLTTGRMVDPFSAREWHPVHGELAKFYTYQKVVNEEELIADAQCGHAPAREAIDLPNYNPGALQKYGKWRLVSNGPDRQYSDAMQFMASDPVLWGSDIAYDPTNGTASWGNILRTQKSSEGETRR